MDCRNRPASFAMTSLGKFIAPSPQRLGGAPRPRPDKTSSGWGTGCSGFTRECEIFGPGYPSPTRPQPPLRIDRIPQEKRVNPATHPWPSLLTNARVPARTSTSNLDLQRRRRPPERRTDSGPVSEGKRLSQHGHTPLGEVRIEHVFAPLPVRKMKRRASVGRALRSRRNNSVPFISGIRIAEITRAYFYPANRSNTSSPRWTAST